jgi:hypothetical protein
MVVNYLQNAHSADPLSVEATVSKKRKRFIGWLEQ